MAYDRIVGSDVSGNLPPIVQDILDGRMAQIAAAAVPVTSALQTLMIGDGSATPPVRPTTNNPVLFNTTTAPPLNGSVAGGTTGMIPNKDVWIGAIGSGSGTDLTVTENPVGSGTYGNRPATTKPVTFEGVVPPNGGGTVAGGTPLMVDGTDKWAQWVLG